MLIRITHSKEGIEHYLESGQKQGRELSRQELDNRVHISGDLNAFAATVQYSRDTKNWKDHYWHITASFAIEDNDIDDEILEKIHDEMMDYYFCGYDKTQIVHACEAHRPRFQSSVDESTGEVRQRLLHFHNAVAKYDPVTGNQIRMIPFKLDADRAFQSYICEKYGLEDPADRKRDIPTSKKEIIARWKGDANVSKQTKVSDLRKLFSQLANDAKSLDDARDILMVTGLVKDIVFKKQKSGNKYLQVCTTEGTKNINLRGKGFEKLETLYYTDKELNDRTVKGKYSEGGKPSLEQNKAIIDAHKKWFLEQQAERAPKNKIDYVKTQKKYENYYDKYSREQRQYFVIYKSNIQEEAIRGYTIFNKNNERHIVNNDLGVRIFDRPDEIRLEIPNDPEKRANAVRLCLSMSTAKGWDLEKMNVTGSVEFKAEVQKQIQEIQAVKITDESLVLPKEPVSTVTPTPPLSAVSSALKQAKEDQQERLSKDQIADMKIRLDAALVITYAAENYGLLSEHFQVTHDNKINDTRTKAKPKNVVDFLTKNCSIPFSKAMPELQKLYQEQVKQEKAPDMDISICTSSNPNGLGGWIHKQPATFTELASLVKTYPYAGFSELKENYRKADNVAALGRCAIFDIDNDPHAPQLSIEQAQELLKGTTFMLVTSKSHQIDKVKPSGEPLPAVDRYRIIVPLTESLSADKDLYRSGMMQLAEQIGLDQYADPKALKDIARQYYKSPADAQVIINNTKQAFNAEPINIFATEEVQRLATEKASARAAVLNRSKIERSEFNADQAAYPKVIDLDAMNQLPLDEIYESLTGNALTQEGSYLMGQGVTAGTSQSRESFTIFESDGQWLWHDFKSSESGNVVSFMREIGYDAFKASEKLSEMFGVELKASNPAYYENALKEALMTSCNDRELQDAIKSVTGAKFVKLEKDSLKIADKEFSLSDLNTTKGDVIAGLRENRDNKLKY